MIEARVVDQAVDGSTLGLDASDKSVDRDGVAEITRERSGAISTEFADDLLERLCVPGDECEARAMAANTSTNSRPLPRLAPVRRR